MWALKTAARALPDGAFAAAVAIAWTLVSLVVVSDLARYGLLAQPSLALLFALGTFTVAVTCDAVPDVVERVALAPFTLVWC